MIVVGLMIVAMAAGAPSKRAKKAAAKASAVTFCEGPTDCGKNQACIAFTCRSGSQRSVIEPLYKIAVVPPLPASADAQLATEAEQLYRDLVAHLKWSGFYEVVEKPELPVGWQREGASPAEVRHSVWQADGVYRVLKGVVARGPGGQTRMRLRLVEIERFGVVDLAQGDVVIAAGQGTGQAAASWVNALIGYDTGIDGAAGTRIAGTTLVRPKVKEVVTVRSDGSDFKQVSDNGSLNLHPAFRPDGSIGWMSYLSGNADWVLNGEPMSTRPGLNAAGAWRPDGRYLALSVAETGDSEILLLDGKTGLEHARLTDHRAVDTSPAWSPDGRRLAFVSDRTNKPNIWILDMKGGPPEQLTREGYNTSPDWSPNGDSLVYVRQVGGGSFAIIRYDMDTKETRRLTDGKPSAESPSFSPDGRYIAFSQKTEEGPRLMVMNADGTGLRSVGPPKSWYAPAWEGRAWNKK